MLRHMGERDAADRVHAALERVYRGGHHLTRDIGGSASTSEFADAVIQEIEQPTAASA
jgi:isocitrate dehydrogenase (NAD+)